MYLIRLMPVLTVAAVMLSPATGVYAQPQPRKNEYTPKIGQSGKDVMWAPTSHSLVDNMLGMANVAPDDYVIDLGSGDGRTVIAAAKRGARAVGIELNPELVALSNRNAEKEGVAGKAVFTQADLFETDLSKASVITMYLLPELNLRLRPKLLALRPGTRIVSNSWDMGEWTPDDATSVISFKSIVTPLLIQIRKFIPASLIEDMKDYCNLRCTAYLWIVPASVEGRWRLLQGELVLKQRFQMVEGTLAKDGRTVTISGGRLRGEQISFAAGGAEYSGRVNNGWIEGSVKSGARTLAWSATLRADNPVSSAKSPALLR